MSLMSETRKLPLSVFLSNWFKKITSSKESTETTHIKYYYRSKKPCEMVLRKTEFTIMLTSLIRSSLIKFQPISFDVDGENHILFATSHSEPINVIISILIPYSELTMDINDFEIIKKI